MSIPSLEPYFLVGSEWTDHLDIDGRWDPQCTVQTRRGPRCSFRIFAGQVYSPVSPTDGRIWISQNDAAIFHAGRCAYHAKLIRDAARGDS